jgi:lipocalin
MRMFWSTLFIFAATIAKTTGLFENNFTTVPALDLEKYQGHWYQVYATPIDFTFQGYGKCITADYGILGPNNVSVLNSQLNKKGELEQISGYAFYKDISKPGQISVTLEGVPFVAPYWVLNLGEVKNNEYQYSIVSVPVGPSLWVLARNILEFFADYDEEVTSLLKHYDFNYVKVDQTSC